MRTASRAVIYTRVSLDEEEGRSVAEQEREARHVCQREGWRVVKVFSDNDRSASRHARKDRPQYAALKEYLTAGNADVLVLWEGSRAQRDLRDYLKLRDLCEERSILYSYSGRTYDMTRTDDRFTTGLDALLAERESDQTRDRVLRAVRANATDGRPHGRLLYGYSREYELRPDRRGRVKPRYVRQVEHPEQAEVVREAARRVRDGESCRSIAIDFNARGIAAPGGGEWDLTQIRRLVTNPGYVAQRVHNGKVVGDGDWPALLAVDVWRDCVRRVTDPRRKTVRDATVKHLLSGALACGVCGSAMRVQKNRGFLAYLCIGNFCVSVKTGPIEDYVTRALKAFLGRPEEMARLAEAGADPGLGKKLAKLKADLDDNEREYRTGTISAKLAGAREADLEAQIEEIERKDKAASVPVSPVTKKLTESHDIDATWDSLSIAQQREVIATHAELKVGRTVRGSRTFDFHRLAESRWRGDSRTWGERWTEAGL